MTTDVVALCKDVPDVHAVLTGLLAAGPDLRMKAVLTGAVVQLLDDDGRSMYAVEGPRLVQVPGEVERLLGPAVSDVDTPVWWVEARAPDTQHQGAVMARTLAEELVRQLGGVVWPPVAAS